MPQIVYCLEVGGATLQPRKIEEKAFKDLQVSIAVWTNVAGWGAREPSACVCVFYSESYKESHVISLGLIQVLKIHSFWQIKQRITGCVAEVFWVLKPSWLLNSEMTECVQLAETILLGAFKI